MELNLRRFPEVQKELLTQEDVLLDYFVGDSSLYIFAVGKDFYDCQYSPKDSSLESQVLELRKSITGKDLYDTSQVTQYARLSSGLYTQLIAPFKDKLTNKNLLIIPDGTLHHFALRNPTDGLYGHSSNRLPGFPLFD